MMECFPESEITESFISTSALPFSSAVTLPRSPTCLSSSFGPPCFFDRGLKWAPAVVQPCVLSPNSWTWNPWSPLVNPSMNPFRTTGPPSFIQRKAQQVWESKCWMISTSPRKVERTWPWELKKSWVTPRACSIPAVTLPQAADRSFKRSWARAGSSCKYFWVGYTRHGESTCTQQTF